MKIGSIVMFTDSFINVRRGKQTLNTLHSAYPEFYPPAKTIGMVVGIRTYGGDCTWHMIQWPIGSTSGNACWLCESDYILELSSRS